MKTKNLILVWGALLLTVMLSSCREEGDVQLNYSYNDQLAFSEAQNSFAGKYRLFWKAMNSNYALWDYEKEQGLDWDEQYDKFLPRFEALDQPGVNVTDSMLRSLMFEMVQPLHDGHFYVTFLNHHTQQFVTAIPSVVRNASRDDSEISTSFVPTVKAYYNHSDVKLWKGYSTIVADQIYDMQHTEGQGYLWVKNRIGAILQKENPTDGDAMELDGLNKFLTAAERIFNGPINSVTLNELNTLITESKYLKIPYLEPIDPSFLNDGIAVDYCLFNDNISYFCLSRFSLSSYLDPEYISSAFPSPSLRTNEQIAHVRDVWESWFNDVQQLHESGQLKGIVLDLRNNPGGFNNDAAYLLGSMLPTGGYQFGWGRFKRGVGRYDYSPLMPMEYQTMNGLHEVISDVPVVVLVNGRSISMSEMSALVAKQMPNARVVGKRTYGGLCSLFTNQYYSFNYSGFIGVEDVTPVFCYVPTMALFDMNKNILDGVGVTPDIEVNLDLDEWKTTGFDTQIDRALEYIRTGK